MPDFEPPALPRRLVGVAALAVAGGLIGRTLLQPAAHPRPPRCRRIPPPPATAAPLPAGAELAVDGITPLVVPERRLLPDRHQPAHPAPRRGDLVAVASSGMVDRPFTLDYDELLAMPLVEQYVTIACVSNEVGGDLVGNALWRGVRLRDVLDRAGVQAGATQVVGRSFDGWTAGFPTAWLDVAEREALVAVAMNGEPLPAEHGFPARLIVPGLFGYVSATKWLTKIELTTLEAFNGYWVPLGWAKEAPILTQSRIDVPGSRCLARRRRAAGGRCRLGAGPRHRQGGGAGRRRGVGGGRALDPDLGRDLGAVALPLGRARRRAHPPRARHRRQRRGADRDRHATGSRRRARLPHHQRQRWVDAPRRIGCVPAPRAPLFIVNPIAGDGPRQRLAPRLEEVLGRPGPRRAWSRPARRGTPSDWRRPPPTSGHDRVVAVGGDGTIAGGAERPDGGRCPARMAAHRPSAWSPAARGNDLARSLGLPLTPMAA